MSHISTYEQTIKDVDLLVNAAIAIEDCTIYRVKEFEKVNMFGSQNISDAVVAIKIPGWRYPVAVTKTGEVKYDFFGSQKGSFEKLGKVLQEYNKRLITSHIPWDQVQQVDHSLKENDDLLITVTY